METILNLDQQLFLAINHLPHNLVFDSAAQFLSGIGKAGLVWFVLAILLFLQQERRDHRFFLPFLTTGVLSGVLVDFILKPLVGRLRPMVEMGALIVGNGTDGLAFPSGHATIAWAMAYVLSRYEPRWRRWLYCLALAISFSRIYLGVHYPLDVIAGGLLGWGIGWGSLQFIRSNKSVSKTTVNR